MVVKEERVLKIEGLKKGVIQMRIFDVFGKEVLKTNYKSKVTTRIKLPFLAVGKYIVWLKIEDGANIKREVMIE